MRLSMLAALATALILAGLMLAIAGLKRHPDPGPSKNPRRSGAIRLARISQRTRMLLLAGLAAGIVLALLTGWILAVVVVPLAVAGVPWLLSNDEQKRHTEKIRALEEWVRALSGAMSARTSLEAAIVATLKSTSEEIKPEVARLVARLNSRMPTRQALTAFANDMDDVIADKIVATLDLGSKRGAGIVDVLDGLAIDVSADVAARRKVSADRATPRTTTRMMTLLTVAVAIGIMLTGDFGKVYTTPLGMAVFALAVAVDIALLLVLRRLGAERRMSRFIGNGAAQTPRETSKR